MRKQFLRRPDMARHHKSAAKHKKHSQSLMSRMHEREGMIHHEERMAEDRRHEREGMEHAMDRRMHRGPRYENDGIEDGRNGGRYMYEPSERREERRSGMMISEDHRAIANMPQYVVYEEYPRERAYLRTNLDDTMSGIDMQQSEDVGMANRHKAKSMY
jgi:hypothetical protein